MDKRAKILSLFKIIILIYDDDDFVCIIVYMYKILFCFMFCQSWGIWRADLQFSLYESCFLEIQSTQPKNS